MCRLFKIVFICVMFSGCATIQDLPDIGMQITSHQVAITNQTDTLQQFLIGEDTENMDEVKIHADETWISHSFQGRPHVKVTHKLGYEEYILMPGLLYVLYFDQRKKHTDIKMYRKRQR